MPRRGADRRREALRNLLLVVVTDRKRCRGDLLGSCEAAVRGGATAVLLRDRDLLRSERRWLAKRLRAITAMYGASLLVHSDVAVAREVGADGVHFSAEDGARRVPGLLVGASCHSGEEVRSAARAGADYAFLGPVFPTRSHPGRPGLGRRAFARILSAARIPVIPIGGIGSLEASLLAFCGRTPRAGVVGAVLGAKDPAGAAGGILGSLKSGKRRDFDAAMRSLSRHFERALVDRILDRIGKPGVLLLGPGDDAAVLGIRGAPVAAATDLTVEGIHYEAGATARAVGFKAAGRALSDLAAVGAKPLGLMVGVAVRRGARATRASAVVLGAGDAGRPFGARVLGGDTKETPATEVVSVTALGSVEGTPPLPRSGGRPGDVLFVTGPLGGSIRGRHLRPRPRIEVGLALRRRALATACIDISDGLATDLHRLCRASGVGALVDRARVPVHRDARDGAGSPFTDGEDYELLFAVPPEKAAAVEARGVAGRRVFRIGRLVHGAAGVLVQDDHGLRGLPDEGWVHFRAR